MAKQDLSKSLLLKGLQCPKQLYLHTYHRELAAPLTPSQKAVFEQGNEVGLAAQKLFPGGVAIDAEYWDVPGAFAKTRHALEKGATILFEATLVHDGVSARADILRQNPGGFWEIIEVKSTTSVKDDHLEDVAIQFWVFKNFGLQVQKVSVMHIDNQFVYPDTGQLFKIVDVTEEALSRQKNVASLVSKLKLVLKSQKPPAMDIGPHCQSPYECGFKDHCWGARKIPSPSIFDLPGLHQRVWEFYSQGAVGVDDPALESLTGVTARAIEVHKTGKRWIDSKEIQRELGSWKWPLSYLDFETIGHAIPKIPLTRPYQQIPFQFSLHIQDEPGAPLRHQEFLHTHDGDPREDLARQLVACLPPEGSIVAYNMAFEKRVIQELVSIYPQLRPQLESFLDRFVDPLPLFRRAVYDEKFLGSFSIKSVAPALIGTDLSYENLHVGDGEAAQKAFKEMIHRATKPERKSFLKQALLQYCEQDTLAMVRLVDWLFQVSHNV